MRALRYSAFGPVGDVLRVENVPEPQPRGHDVVVRTRFVGINPLDWKLVEGQFRLMAKSRAPCGVGAEFSGEVLHLGAKVSEFTVGDRVTAWINPFTEPPRALAEQVRVPASQCVRVPPGVGLDTAAVVPVAGLSALQMIELIKLQSGQRVLVHGAASGVGSFVLPMLHDRGATVVATGSARSQEFIRSLRPDAQVDRSTPPSAWLGPFDAVIDCASTLDAGALAVLLSHGGYAAATLPRFPGVIFDPFLNPFRRIRRATLRLNPNTAQIAQILAMIDDGRLPVCPVKVFPLEEAIAALQESRTGAARGKLAVAMPSSA